MKQINLKISSLSGLSKNVQQWFNYLLWFLLAALFIWEIFTIKTSVSVIFMSQNSVIAPTKHQDVRVDFAAYKQALQRVQQAQDYAPATSTPVNNPFQVGQ